MPIVLALDASDAAIREARALTSEGRARLALLDRTTRLPVLLPAARVLVSGRLPLFHLHDALARRSAGQLADVRLWLDGPAPEATAIGLRHRPWLSAVHHPLGAPAPRFSVAPAPISAVASLSALIDDWGPPPVAQDEVPCPLPRVLQIQTTTACEAHCPYCPHDQLAGEPREMDDALFDDLLSQCAPGVDGLELFLQAEPLRDPRLPALAGRAKARCPDALVSIVTHERALDDAQADRLAGCGLDAVFVSVNPLSLPTERTRLEEALRRRLQPLARRRERLRSGGTELVLTTLVDLLPAGAAGALRRACRELDLPAERFRATSRLGDADLSRWRDAPGVPAPAICERPFHKAYVRYDGALVLCCEDWRHDVVLGDLRRTSLAEAWTGPAYRAVRRALLEGRPSAPCDRCDYRRPVPANGARAEAG